MTGREPGKPYIQCAEKLEHDTPKKRGPNKEGILETKDMQQVTSRSSDSIKSTKQFDSIKGTEQYKNFCKRYGIVPNERRKGPQLYTKKRGPYKRKILQTQGTQQSSSSSLESIKGTEQYKNFCMRYGIVPNPNRRGPYKHYAEKSNLHQPKERANGGPEGMVLLQTKDSQQTTSKSRDFAIRPKTYDPANKTSIHAETTEKENVDNSLQPYSSSSEPMPVDQGSMSLLFPDLLMPPGFNWSPDW